MTVADLGQYYFGDIHLYKKSYNEENDTFEYSECLYDGYIHDMPMELKAMEIITITSGIEYIAISAVD